MKIKVIGFLGIVALATGIFFATNASGSKTDVNLNNVIGISNANAECCWGFPDGRCSFGGNCFPDPGGTFVNCDSTLGWC
jgi:hypothetical protein